MRRADRLFQIIQLLRRRRRAITAAEMAEKLGVSERTVYRDMSDLSTSGVPIRGEAGVGYVLAATYDLPPLMLTEEEVEALVLGARVVESWADPELGAAANVLLSKVQSVLPERLRQRLDEPSLFAFSFRSPRQQRALLGDLRRALNARRKVRFAYTDRSEQQTERTVRPVGLFYWGVTWTLAAWCELRDDFRSFRVDRIDRFSLCPETFEVEPGKTLEDLLRRYRDD